MARQQQDDVRLLRTAGQNSIPSYSNQQRSQNIAMNAVDAQPTSQVATDQYHHKETIWRVILDFISLIICKTSRISL